jgi:formate/nitrite transporter
MSERVSLDGLLPPEIADRAERVGVAKGGMPFVPLFVLAVLAGAFIALGCVFYTTVIAGNGYGEAIALPSGIVRALGGLAFCLGLVLVVVGGAELFTGNALMVMAVASGKLPMTSLLRNWIIVYFGNFAGALTTALLIFLSQHHTFGDCQIGLAALRIGQTKCSLDFVPALILGIYCNALVCLAVWLCLSCRSTTDKILAILLPISAFVAAGFEHSIANMYFIPLALFVKTDAAFLEIAAPAGLSITALSWSNFILRNLIPVTIGNIIGGSVFVGIVYWLVYCRQNPRPETPR